MRINCIFLEFMELKNNIFINESILKELYFRLDAYLSSCKIIALFFNMMKVGKKLDKTCNALHEFIQIKCPFRYKNYL